MIILGLTGSIGCGKSSLSNILRDNNINIIDADIISRKIFEDEKLLASVFEHFGDSIKNEDGSLNRKALGNIVFNDDNKLIELNNLTHPKIKEKILSEIEKVKLFNKNIISQEDKVKYADYVLDNSGDLEELKEKTKEFLLYMKENWCG